MRFFFFPFYALAIGVAEWITVAVSPIGGITFYLVILFFLILHSSLSSNKYNGKLYLSIALVPIFRILSLTLPLVRFPMTYWYLIISVPMLAGAFIVMKLLGLRLPDVGLRLPKPLMKQIFIQGSAIVVGIGFACLAYYLFNPKPITLELSWNSWFLPAIMFLISGFTEELVFRGILQSTAVRTFGNWGILYVAMVSSTLYISYLSWLHWVFALALGLFFGVIVEMTQSIVGVSLSRSLINVIFYVILPFIWK